jgi:ribonucleoside-triphosphate reductase
VSEKTKKVIKYQTVITETIMDKIESLNEDILDISTIEQVIFNTLSDTGQYNTARAYENFRSVREFQRSVADDIEVQVNELVDGSSDYWNNENSNKNAKIITTQRDYMAGILSTHISKKYLMSPELVQAHNEGIIHQHDMDYMAQNAISNCFSGDTRLVTNYGVRSFNSFG